MITDAFLAQAVGEIGRYCYEYGCALAALPDFEVHIFTPGGTYQERTASGMTVHEIPTNYSSLVALNTVKVSTLYSNHLCTLHNLPQVVSRLASTYNTIIEHAALHIAA
jgi:hypothetical protein